ncbi:MAG: hypothetical protein ACOY5C_13870 [Pseudomonadota bacterium]
MGEHVGNRLTIRYCDGAEASLQEALRHIPAHLKDRCIAQFVARRNLLADGEQMRKPEHFNTEGALPDGGNFFAIKTTQGLRAYGWFSSRHRHVFFISHFVFKNYDKLKRADEDLVRRNWEKEER